MANGSMRPTKICRNHGTFRLKREGHRAVVWKRVLNSRLLCLRNRSKERRKELLCLDLSNFRRIWTGNLQVHLIWKGNLTTVCLSIQWTINLSRREPAQTLHPLKLRVLMALQGTAPSKTYPKPLVEFLSLHQPRIWRWNRGRSRKSNFLRREMKVQEKIMHLQQFYFKILTRTRWIRKVVTSYR